MKAVLIVSHGSRSPKTKQEVSLLVDAISKQLPEAVIEHAFLEIETPDIPLGIDQCAARGADQIVVTLNFLNSGRHVNDDIPAIVAAAQKKYPQIAFSITRPIGRHPRIPDLFIDLINEEFRR